MHQELHKSLEGQRWKAMISNLNFPVAQTVKNPPAMQTWVQSLGREDPLEKAMTTHSSILA